MFSLSPVPPDSELIVQHLTEPEGKFVEDEQSNTFAVNFTWDPPSFKYKGVLFYNVSYQFSGYARDQFQSYTKTSTVSTKEVKYNERFTTLKLLLR